MKVILSTQLFQYTFLSTGPVKMQSIILSHLARQAGFGQYYGVGQCNSYEDESVIKVNIRVALCQGLS